MIVPPSIPGPRKKQSATTRISEQEAQRITKADPPPNPDGSCLICRKQRHPERSKSYAGVTAELDPFCSCECARVWYQNPIPGKSVCSLYDEAA